MTQQSLVSFFQLVSKKDAVLLAKLKKSGTFVIEENSWQFTLPDLHQFLQKLDDNFSGIDYREFKTLLYASPINSKIGKLGAKITVSDNQGKVDASSYALNWTQD